MDIEFFRTLIIKTRKNLQLQNAEIPEGVELDQSRVGRLSRMDAMQGHEMTLEARRRRAVDIKRMDEALFELRMTTLGIVKHVGKLSPSDD